MIYTTNVTEKHCGFKIMGFTKTQDSDMMFLDAIRDFNKSA